MDTHADEVSERLAGIRRHLGRLRRAGAKDGGNVDRSILQDGVRRSHRTDIAAGTRVRHPWSWSDLAVLVDHLGRVVSLPDRARRIEERSGPISKRDARPRTTVGPEVAARVGDR